MGVFARLANEFSQRMENHAAAEGTRLRRKFPRKGGFLSIMIGILVVFLLALWMAYHP